MKIIILDSTENEVNNLVMCLARDLKCYCNDVSGIECLTYKINCSTHKEIPCATCIRENLILEHKK